MIKIQLANCIFIVEQYVKAQMGCNKMENELNAVIFTRGICGRMDW
jgi:hypothetical protein